MSRHERRLAISVGAALERRETRDCHNRSGPGRLEREAIPPILDEIAVLMHDVSAAGKLLQ